MLPPARVVALFLSVLGVLLIAVPGADAASKKGSGLRVTLVARECPSYTDIMANRARNDIQESLKDLGENTVYTARQPIGPGIEQAKQPNCMPLVGWSFKLGTDYASRAVSGPWGALSIVKNPYDGEPVTKAQTSLLNASSDDTGEKLAGAVTIELTKKQADRAATDNSLWIQGGTVADPILDQRFPGQYGFGALRCAVDNLNGDNVEWIAFPTGASHVFCYAYYVKPPPTSGTIVVQKQVDAAEGTAPTDFDFTGNLSYNSDGRFTLNAAPGKPASQTFFRAAGTEPWTVQEVAEPGWTRTSLTCTDGPSRVAVDQATGTATITLAPGDTVVCTYINAFTPPAGLTLAKVTDGGVGTTTFTIGGASSATASVTTTEEGLEAATSFGDLPPGEYTVAEQPERTPGGTWRRTAVQCDGQPVADPPDPLPLTLAPGSGTFCTFFNSFTPDGSITVRKRTFFGTGTTGFVITRVGSDPPQVYSQSATTRRPEEIVEATGDPTNRVALGSYDIQELVTSNADGGSWELDQVNCNGQPYGSAEGRVRVTLTRARPAIDCTFSNRHRDKPPPAGGVLPGTASSGPANPVTNLVVRKSVRPRRILSGHTVRYRVTVINRGDVVAEDVVGSETRPPSGTRVDVVGPRGVRCRSKRPLVCLLGDMPPHSRITLTADVRTPVIGRVVNRVAVHTATAETRLGDNRARAVLHVRRLPRFTG